MKLLPLDVPAGRELVFYLSVEEYVAGSLPSFLEGTPFEGVFFLWRTPPTVIFGRNQVMEAEVDRNFCREKGITLSRRKSGGGCVYSDSGNIMVSCILPSTDVKDVFGMFLSALEGFLRSVGVDASISGRNDVMAGGRKVSGNAFLRMTSSSVIHGTLLYDCDLETMQRAITPHPDKVKSKGVDSVRSHVANISSLMEDPLPIGEFMEKLKEYFCGSTAPVALSPSSFEEVLKVEETYLDPSFISGRKHSYSIERGARVDGVGEVDVEMDLEGDSIQGLHLGGDFLSLREGIDDLLSERLRGRPDDREAAEKALEGLVMENYVLNLTSKAFLDVAFGKKGKPKD